MEEKRKARRWQPDSTEQSVVICGGLKNEVRIADVSIDGMRVHLPRPVEEGADIYGKLTILSGMGPFFIKGKVMRVARSVASWETAVRFDKVRTYSFFDANIPAGTEKQVAL